MAIKDLFTLNPEQQTAVEYNEGPLLIIAGAGTGKTRVIVEKIRDLIVNKSVSPESILALTFTEKAAYEMEERVDKALPYGYFDMWIETFHSFAERILRDEIKHIGLNPGYSVMTESESIVFFREHLFSFNLEYFRPLGNPNKFIAALLNHFARLRDEDITPAHYVKWAEEKTVENLLKEDQELVQEEADEIYKRNLELAKAYEAYQNIKIKEGKFDFADLIHYTIEVFRKRPSVLKKYQQMFQYILVDEFQDTNIAQYALVKLLTSYQPKPHLTVVGDDSQAIYKFRGASVSNIMTFMKDYPEAKQVTLNKNYRSFQEILDYSYRLIKHNDPDTLEAQLGISKQLTSSKGSSKDAVKFYVNQTGQEEADSVAQEVIELVQKQKYRFGDIALLVRANSHADIFINTFARHGIPFRFLGPGALFKQAEVKDLIAYLKILGDTEDSVSFYRVLTMDIFKLDQRDIHSLLAFAKKITRSLLEATEIYLSFSQQEWFRKEYQVYAEYLPILSDSTKESLLKILTMFRRHLKLVRKEPAVQILFYFLEDTGYLNLLTTSNSEKEERKVQNITKFFNKINTYAGDIEKTSVFSILEYIDMTMELGESPSSDDTDTAIQDAITISTVHGSKGLEFPVVFLVSLIKGRFPTIEKKEQLPIPLELLKETLPQGDYHLEEERRLCYVGQTRAMDKLYLTAALTYGEGKRQRKVSPFVYETIGEAEVEKALHIKKETQQQLNIFDFKPAQAESKPSTNSIKNLSFSQLETYKTCPLQYKYQYVLKIPTSAGAAASFGDTIHKTLQQFYTDYLQDTSLGIEYALSLFNTLWVPIGYTTPEYELKMREQGENMLRSFFNAFHPPHANILSLEKLFKIKVSEDLSITGKIDRVDKSPSTDEIEVIDYKTGSMPNEKELQKSLQLSIYALAASDRGMFNKPLSTITLTFYYLKEQKKVSMKRTEEEIVKVKEDILKTAEEIQQSNFAPKVGPWCSYCPFKMICEAWR